MRIKFYLGLFLYCLPFWVQAQCSSAIIDQSNYSIYAVDSEETEGEGSDNGHAIHAIDGNTATFWHSKWKNFDASFPHFIAVDLGDSYPVDGLQVTTRGDISNTKPAEYRVLLSDDGVAWSTPQAIGFFSYEDPKGTGQMTEVTFGAVQAQYVQLDLLSSVDGDVHVSIAELNITQITGDDASCVATGQLNQLMTFPPIGKRYVSEGSITPDAALNTELPVSYEVLTGPAEVEGNKVVFTGEGGEVTLRAYNDGSDEFYPIELTQTFTVVNTNQITPSIYTRLVETSPILMPELMAYPLAARAEIEEDEVLDIIEMAVYADGEKIESSYYNGGVSAYWTPDSFGTHTLVFEATGSNGQNQSIERTVEVSSEIEDMRIHTLDKAVIDWGSMGSQWYYGTYELPQSIGAFSNINALWDVRCPQVAGGCDDYDRLAYVQIKNERGEWTELFRYITPFGKGCFHETDLTHLQSLLQGEIEFRVYIDTWGSGGWMMDLVFEFEAGTPEYAYTLVEKGWQGRYNFGDPANLQPVPVVTFDAPEETEVMEFRLVTTGHGWGNNNSGNAAEFYYAQHKLKVNGEDAFDQSMRVSCNPNPDGCNNQLGTWQYDRAGWCPGTIPKTYVYNTTPYKDEAFTFEYEFQPSYIDACHPNSSSCVSGITCPNCNDGYNPFYQVGGFMIYKSNTPMNLLTPVAVEEVPEYELQLFPNPSTHYFTLTLDQEMQDFVVEVQDVSGKSYKRYYFNHSDELMHYSFDISAMTAGTYFVKVYDHTSVLAKKLVIVK